jgi:xanthine dehydrogenase accessory factor
MGSTLTTRDVVCVLTHDAKFDVPALVAALDTDVGYIGAMGSRRTHADRVKRLLEAGVDHAALGRIRAPVGLDIGARTPEETAVSICAEIIAQRTGRADARPLRDTEGPIHH